MVNAKRISIGNWELNNERWGEEVVIGSIFCTWRDGAVDPEKTGGHEANQKWTGVCQQGEWGAGTKADWNWLLETDGNKLPAFTFLIPIYSGMCAVGTHSVTQGRERWVRQDPWEHPCDDTLGSFGMGSERDHFNPQGCIMFKNHPYSPSHFQSFPSDFQSQLLKVVHSEPWPQNSSTDARQGNPGKAPGLTRSGCLRTQWQSDHYFQKGNCSAREMYGPELILNMGTIRSEWAN